MIAVIAAVVLAQYHAAVERAPRVPSAPTYGAPPANGTTSMLLTTGSRVSRDSLNKGDDAQDALDASKSGFFFRSGMTATRFPQDDWLD